MQPKSQFSSCNLAQKALAPIKPQRLSLQSSSAQEGLNTQEPSNSVRRAQLLSSGHAAQESIQLRQFSPKGLNAHNAHKAPTAQFIELISSGRPQSPGAQQLSSTSSTTQLIPCSPRVSSVQEFSPQGLSA